MDALSQVHAHAPATMELLARRNQLPTGGGQLPTGKPSRGAAAVIARARQQVEWMNASSPGLLSANMMQYGGGGGGEPSPHGQHMAHSQPLHPQTSRSPLAPASKNSQGRGRGRAFTAPAGKKANAGERTASPAEPVANHGGLMDFVREADAGRLEGDAAAKERAMRRARSMVETRDPRKATRRRNPAVALDAAAASELAAAERASRKLMEKVGGELRRLGGVVGGPEQPPPPVAGEPGTPIAPADLVPFLEGTWRQLRGHTVRCAEVLRAAGDIADDNRAVSGDRRTGQEREAREAEEQARKLGSDLAKVRKRTADLREAQRVYVGLVEKADAAERLSGAAKKGAGPVVDLGVELANPKVAALEAELLELKAAVRAAGAGQQAAVEKQLAAARIQNRFKSRERERLLFGRAERRHAAAALNTAGGADEEMARLQQQMSELMSVRAEQPPSARGASESMVPERDHIAEVAALREAVASAERRAVAAEAAAEEASELAELQGRALERAVASPRASGGMLPGADGEIPTILFCYRPQLNYPKHL